MADRALPVSTQFDGCQDDCPRRCTRIASSRHAWMKLPYNDRMKKR
jgi:hypothetical protein